MFRRLAAVAVLLTLFAIPSEAGFFSLRRKPKRPKQAKAAQYGMSHQQHQKQVNKGRSKAQRKLNPVTIRPSR
jgi:hypothetical protein